MVGLEKSVVFSSSSAHGHETHTLFFCSPPLFFPWIPGVSGLINVASDLSFTDDIGLVESVKSLTKGVLKSAQAAGSVKSVVFTSSRVAAFGEGSADTTYSDKDWFNEAFDLAKIVADDAQKRGLICE